MPSRHVRDTHRNKSSHAGIESVNIRTPAFVYSMRQSGNASHTYIDSSGSLVAKCKMKNDTKMKKTVVLLVTILTKFSCLDNVYLILTEFKRNLAKLSPYRIQ